MIFTNAEQYIVNGLLFQLGKPQHKVNDQGCFLLVIPEKFENTVFHLYHNSLLGAHFGPLNTMDKYFMHNMFQKLDRYISSCEACQQQKSLRKVSLDTFIQGFH